jgi:hypothetical protein
MPEGLDDTRYLKARLVNTFSPDAAADYQARFWLRPDESLRPAGMSFRSRRNENSFQLSIARFRSVSVNWKLFSVCVF